jgi:hypothetical protein
LCKTITLFIINNFERQNLTEVCWVFLIAKIEKIFTLWTAMCVEMYTNLAFWWRGLHGELFRRHLLFSKRRVVWGSPAPYTPIWRILPREPLGLQRFPRKWCQEVSPLPGTQSAKKHIRARSIWMVINTPTNSLSGICRTHGGIRYAISCTLSNEETTWKSRSRYGKQIESYAYMCMCWSLKIKHKKIII